MNAFSLLMVGLGAVLGAWSRWFFGSFLNAVYPPIPLGTLVVNLTGGFLMGIALVLLIERGLLPPELRAAIVTGFLGSFTTMSAFSAEAMTLIARAEYLLAVGHVLLHVVGSILLVFLGAMIAREFIAT